MLRAKCPECKTELELKDDKYFKCPKCSGALFFSKKEQLYSIFEIIEDPEKFGYSFENFKKDWYTPW